MLTQHVDDALLGGAGQDVNCGRAMLGGAVEGDADDDVECRYGTQRQQEEDNETQPEYDRHVAVPRVRDVADKRLGNDVIGRGVTARVVGARVEGVGQGTEAGAHPHHDDDPHGAR